MTLAELKALAEAAKRDHAERLAQSGSERGRMSISEGALRLAVAASPDVILAMIEVCEAVGCMVVIVDGNTKQPAISWEVFGKMQAALAALAEKMESIP